jgi:hypothetical protein
MFCSILFIPIGIFSPDCSGNPFYKKIYFFVVIAERPTEAPVMAYKK